MRLKSCKVNNFGSYESLEFSFENIGLGLIYGATGSGKSTICDIVPWILYGVTSKNGNADEIRSWNKPNEVTRGELTLELKDCIITVVRTRGKSGQNDLGWTEEGSDIFNRGKDLNETQKLLEKRLDVPSNVFIAGSYYHEFSTTSSFFIAKAKDRRALLENIAPLDLPVLLVERIGDAKKKLKKRISEVTNELARSQGAIESLRAQRDNNEISIKLWDNKHAGRIQELKTRAKNFDLEKQSKIDTLNTKYNRFEDDRLTKAEDLLDKIEKLEVKIKPDSHFTGADKCPECGAINSKLRDAQLTNLSMINKLQNLKDALNDVSTQENKYIAELQQAQTLTNHYLDQIAHESTLTNPFVLQTAIIDKQIVKADATLEASLKELSGLQHEVKSIDHIYDLSFDLRGYLLKRAVKDIEISTNRYLETYFDSEIKVEFNLIGSDDLEVNIQKSGYECVYRQLSKGQRGLLKLAFVVSMMKATANRAGAHFNVLMFDEALDGLDPELKVKAYNLFCELEKEHESILLIDHSTELKSMFSHKYEATLTGDISTIKVEDEH